MVSNRVYFSILHIHIFLCNSHIVCEQRLFPRNDVVIGDVDVVGTEGDFRRENI